ncbi:MAG: hypothetical protein JWM28_1444 [Chitinophagaceae bacterium]|nr:hypothetical protein [Chitinophagaceae bacterium]
MPGRLFLFRPDSKIRGTRLFYKKAKSGDSRSNREFLLFPTDYRRLFGDISGKNTLLCNEFGVLYSFTSPERFVFPLMFIRPCLLLALILFLNFSENEHLRRKS